MEGALRRAEHLDLARGVGLHPEDGLVLADVAQQRAEDQGGHGHVRSAGNAYSVGRCSTPEIRARRTMPWPRRSPPASRHPLRALDAKAMELASRDEELRAALFRLVDVTPACRSLDDLARHLTGFLERGATSARRRSRRAMRMARHARRAGAALGAAAAAGVRHMAHRFIVGESPQAALRALARLWTRRRSPRSVDLLGEATVTEEEADRYAARCAEALGRSPATRSALARAAAARARLGRATAARRTCR